jgi:Mn-containing catalase
MFMHNKRLMHTVRVAEPNPRLATLMLEQFGGPQGELAAAMRYFTQALSDDDSNRKDMLMDIATEELSHLEVIGNIVCMLNKGVKADMAEGAEQGQLMSEVFHGGESHTTSLLYGGGVGLINSGGALGPRPTSIRSVIRPAISAPTSPPKRAPRSSTSASSMLPRMPISSVRSAS